MRTSAPYLFLLLSALVASSASAFVVPTPKQQQHQKIAGTQLNGWLDNAFANDSSLGKAKDAGKSTELGHDVLT